MSDCVKIVLSENFSDGMDSTEIDYGISHFMGTVAEACEFIYQGANFWAIPCSSSKLPGGDL